MRERFRGVRVTTDDGFVDWAALNTFAAEYNPDPKYAELLSAAIHEGKTE